MKNYVWIYDTWYKSWAETQDGPKKKKTLITFNSDDLSPFPKSCKRIFWAKLQLKVSQDSHLVQTFSNTIISIICLWHYQIISLRPSPPSSVKDSFRHFCLFIWAGPSLNLQIALLEWILSPIFPSKACDTPSYVLLDFVPTRTLLMKDRQTADKSKEALSLPLIQL